MISDFWYLIVYPNERKKFLKMTKNCCAIFLADGGLFKVKSDGCLTFPRFPDQTDGRKTLDTGVGSTD